ncbi:MAG: phage terminase large subunit family protein [Bryobacterales bacterium]|nr:phage terminase large subunit family protein [Bryobacterales bacterium]
MSYDVSVSSKLLEAAATAILPARRVSLSEWAEEHYRLSSESSAQPGPVTLLAYQREPLDCMGPHSGYQTVVLVWASQMSKTSVTLAMLAHMMAEDPGPALVVQPTLIMAEAFSKERLAPMLRDVPILRGKVAESRARDASSTIYTKAFIGGQVSIATSNSPAGLASRPIRYLILDEVDRFEASAGSEGDPVDLARARTRSFWNRKIVMTSSPTIKGASRIEVAWAESDQRYYHVPCPHCENYQVLTWRRVEYEDANPGEAQYRCSHCEKLIPHHRKLWMLARGRWVATQPGRAAAGFHLSELYSPWRTWGEMAEDWIRAQGSPERLRSFINTSLAEWWDDQAAGGVKEAELLARREAYGPVLPDRVALLTAGVDVQADRVEVSVWGWGAGEESWLMTHRVIPGDPSTPALWAALDAFLSERWQHPIVGLMPLHAVCIDSGAFTGMVTRFCDERRGRRVFAIKAATGTRPVWPRRESKAPKGRVWVIGVDALRQTIAHRLRITEGPGRMHFPATVGLDYMEQLLSEFPRTEYRRGRPVRVWERRKGRRAEAWDCANYALAGVYALAAHGITPDVESARIEAMRQTGAVVVEAYRTSRSRFVSG